MMCNFVGFNFVEHYLVQPIKIHSPKSNRIKRVFQLFIKDCLKFV